MNAVHLEIVGQNCHMICEMCCSRLFGCNSYRSIRSFHREQLASGAGCINRFEALHDAQPDAAIRAVSRARRLHATATFYEAPHPGLPDGLVTGTAWVCWHRHGDVSIWATDSHVDLAALVRQGAVVAEYLYACALTYQRGGGAAQHHSRAVGAAHGGTVVIIDARRRFAIKRKDLVWCQPADFECPRQRVRHLCAARAQCECLSVNKAPTYCEVNEVNVNLRPQP